MESSLRNPAVMTRLALLIAMNCISAYLVIPLPFSQSPLALQTLVVNLVAFLLPPKQAAITMLAYLFIGLIGVPVFTAGAAGPGKLFGPTGGYIIGFAVAAVLISWLKGKKYDFKRYSLVSILVGMPTMYVLGAIQLQFLTGMPWSAVLLSGVIPFIPLDIVKCLGAAALARPVRQIFQDWETR